MKDYTEDKVLWNLRSKGVGIQGTTLFIDSGDLGIKNLGKVDFLVNHKKYRVVFKRDESRK